ncbi:T-cell surface antigen CD2 isoform X2 [Parus major]|uniref:T-cell surface antigen CD2 isoform X2 n=1 Tax=Parus major TaxID=9157 RepID=UPI0007715BE9|nr:T-cell surface antigen CD2 isoform X2 [Parus major]
MNFRRIFLVKCLLLLFPSVKCSSTSWIYKAVNETALLSITAPGSFHEATWTKGRQRLVQIKGNSARHFVNKDQCRCAILRNGTLQIKSVEKGDSGNYTVMAYQQDGKLKAEENIMFFVQGPVPQPILTAECGNKSVSVKCEAKEKAKDEAFLMELTQPNGKTIQKNATVLEWHGSNSGTFRCVAKNQVSEKMAEKIIKCPEEERVMQPLPVDRERGMRELPQTPSTPTPKRLRVQQRPLPPQPPQPPLPPQPPQPPRPQPRPRAQPRTPNLPRERP